MPHVKDVLPHLHKSKHHQMDVVGFEIFEVQPGQSWWFVGNQHSGPFDIHHIRVNEQGMCVITGTCPGDCVTIHAYDSVEIKTFIKSEVKFW